MKKAFQIMTFAMLSIAMLACGGKEKKLTQEDLKAAEATLFNEDRTVNEEAAPQVVETFCKFVEQNPEDSTADRWLFHAMEINVLLKNADKSAELCEQLTAQYPQSQWAPRSLLLLGSFVYNDQLNDTAMAHVTLQRLIDEYPESELVVDAQKSIEYLGLTPDEIMAKIMMSQMEETGAEFEE